MAFVTTRAQMSTVVTNFIGSNSTIIDSMNASASDPVHVCIQNIQGAVFYIAASSAGTTANSFRVPAFYLEHLDVKRAYELFGFTSAGVTCNVVFTANGQG